MAAFLTRTPVTDIATCVRKAPVFAWNEVTLRLLGTDGGLRLALRALDRLPRSETDAALGRATREVLAGPLRSRALPAVTLLGHRALALATTPPPYESGDAPGETDAIFARAIGAVAARRDLLGDAWSGAPADRERLAAALASAASRAADAERALEPAP
jgi:hypothetical protein